MESDSSESPGQRKEARVADTKDLAMILKAGIPIIAVESTDERRVLSLLLQLAMEQGLAFNEWRVTSGLTPGGLARGSHGYAGAANGRSNGHAVDDALLAEPEAVLRHIATRPGPALYALCDFHPYLTGEPRLIRYLKDAALDAEHLRNTVVLVSHAVTIPPEVGRLTAKFSLRLPSDEELFGMVRAQAREWAEINQGSKVRTDQQTLDRLVANLRGVSHADARVLIRHAVFGDGAITESDIPEVNRLKFELLDAEGVLRFEYDTEELANVAGLDRLKAWLGLRQRAFLEARADRPKGVMLLGVQGGGKSLAARAIAGYWGLPLLRLDFGTLYNKYYGETERNLRNSLRQAEMMAPCVLWMDEIEKGVATGDSDNATPQRVLSTLLTWMAENPKPVFIVATANDITALPPELLRKGRLDELFFVDLPDHATRQEIFRIHLGRRDLAPEDFDLTALADATDGYTGAEIEQAIVSARYLADAGGTAVADADLLRAIDQTHPLSVTHAEHITALRAWARDRTVPA
jgi:MoxR-like ATPase